MARSDIPFSGDDAHAFLPWVIGIMACMATLLLCLGVTMGGWIIDRSSSYSDSFTVNIPSSADGLTDKATKIQEELRKLPGITDVTQISESRLRETLAPWFGSSDAVAALPVPVVLEVTTGKNAVMDYKAIQTQMASIAAGTEVDAHELWVENFSNFFIAIRSLMTGLAVIIIGGLALIIAFMSRASLKLHAKTIQLLHSIGAEDNYITRQFQYEAFLLTLEGTVPGCLAAGAAYWAAGIYMSSLQSSVLPPLSMNMSHLVLLLSMPLACGIVAWVSARIAVLEQLKQVL